MSSGDAASPSLRAVDVMQKCRMLDPRMCSPVEKFSKRLSAMAILSPPHPPSLPLRCQTPSMEAADARNLERFRRQYFQLLDLHELAWPSRTILRSANAQAWLYANLFSSEATKYLPPTRYQLRVLKTLLKSIEDSIEDPEEDVCTPARCPSRSWTSCIVT